MRHVRLIIIIGWLGLCYTVALTPATAEWFLDAYVGSTLGINGNVRVQEGAASASDDADFDWSFTAGGRIGRWFSLLPWLGVALDGSVFQPQVESLFTLTTTDEADLSITALSGLFMLRASQGRLQPYVGIGPAVFLADLDVGGFSDDDASIGLDVRVGLSWRFSRPLGLFVEYRFTYSEHKFTSTLRGVPTEVHTKLDLHHVLVGASLRF